MPIDSLDIKISAEANKANASIEKLIKKFDRLSASLSGVNSRGLSTLASGVNNISNAVNNFSSNVRTSDFTKIAKGLNKLATVQPGNMQAVGNALRPLASGINTLSSANFDSRNINNLINSLTRLSNANVSGIANLDFTALGNSIKSLANTLSGADKVQQNTISMTNAIAKLASAGTNAGNAAAALPNLSKELKNFMQTMSGSFNIEQGTISMTQALAQLASAGKKAEATAKSLDLFGNELLKFFQTMSKAPSVSTSTIQMTQALAQLASTGSRARGAVDALGNVFSSTRERTKSLNININILSKSLDALKKSFKGTVSGVKTFSRGILSAVGTLAGVYGSFEGIKKAIDISSDLTEVQNVIDVSFGNYKDKIEDFSKVSITDFGMSELTAKQMAGRFQSMGLAMGFAQGQMADMSVELTKLAADMSSFYNVEQDEMATSLQSIFTGETEPLRRYGIDLTQATLQEWALKRGIDANIESMSQMEKTMLRYQYVMANTEAAQGDFARTSDTWANQVRVLKQSFEVLGSTVGGILINVLKPFVAALNQLMVKINDFAKVISESLGAIFGWTSEEPSKGVINDFSEGFNDASNNIEEVDKKAEKLKKNILGFDQLNVLSENKEIDVGESGDLDTSGKLLDNIGSNAKKTADDIQNAFSGIFDTFSKAWEEVGQPVVESFQTMLDNIKGVLVDIGKTFYGVFTSDTGVELIKSILTLFRSIFDIINEISEVFRTAWNDGGGYELVEALFKMFTKINNLLSDIGDSFTRVFGNGIGLEIWSNILGIITGIFNIIGNLAGSIQKAWETAGLGDSVWNSVLTAVNSILEALRSVIDTIAEWAASDGAVLWAESVLKLLRSIFDIIGSIATAFTEAWNDGGGYELVSNFFDMFTDINNLLATIGDSFARVFSNGTGTEIISNILGIFSDIFATIGNIAEGIKEAWEEGGLGDSIWQGILDIINNILTTIHNITSATKEWEKELDFKPLLESIDELLKAIEPLTKNIGEGLEWFWTNVLLPMAGWTIEEAVPTFLDMLSAAIDALNKTLETFQPLAQWLLDEFLQPLGEFVGDVIVETLNLITDALKGLGDWISDRKESVEGFTEILDDFVETFKKTETVSKIKDSLAEAFNKIKEAAKPLTDAIGDLIDSLIDFYKNSPIKTIVELFTMLQSTLAGDIISIAIKNISDTISNFAQMLEGAIEIFSGILDVLTGIFTLDFDKAAEGFEKIIDGIVDFVSGNFGSMFDAGKNLIEGLLGGIKDAVKNIGSWIKENVVDPIINWFKNLFGIHSPSTVMEELGGFLMQGLFNGISNMVESVTEIFTNIKDTIGGVWDELTEKTSEIWEGISGTVSETWENLKGWATEKFESVKESVSSAWDEVSSKTEEVWDGVSEKASEVWGNLKDWASDKFTSVKNSVSTAWENVKTKTITTWDNVSQKASSVWETLKTKASSKFSGIKSDVTDAWDNIKSKTATTWDNVKLKAEGVWSSLKNKSDTKFDNIKGYVLNAWKSIAEDTPESWDSVKTAVNSVITSIVNKVKNLPAKFLKYGKDIASGLSKGISGAVNFVKKGVSDLSSGVVDFFENDMEIHSPSKVMEELGKYTVQGLVIGLENGENSIGKWADDVEDEITGSIPDSDSWYSSDGMKDTSDSMKETIDKTLEEIKISWNETWKELGETVSNISDSVKETIESLLVETGEVLSSSLEESENWISGVFENVLNKLDETVEGINSTIEETLNNITDNINELTGTSSENINTSVDEIKEHWTSSFEEIGESTSAVFDDISEKVNDTVSTIIEKAMEMSESVSSSIEGITGLNNDTYSESYSLGEDIALGFEGGIQDNEFKISTKLEELGREIAGKMGPNNDIYSKSYGIGKNVVSGIENGIKNNTLKVSGIAKTLAKTITGEMEDELEIKSPSKVMKRIGEYTVEGLSSGLESGTGNLSDWSNGIVDMVKESVPDLYNDGKNVMEDFINGMESMPMPELNIKAKGNITPDFLKYSKENLVPQMSNVQIPKTGNRFGNYENESMTERVKDAVIQGMMEVFMATRDSQNNQNNAPVLEYTFKMDSETLYKLVLKGKQKYDRRYNVASEF